MGITEMQKPWFMAQGPANIEIKDCVIDGENYSGKLTKQVVPDSFICGYPVTEVAHLISVMQEYRTQNNCVHYALADSFQLLRDYTGRVEKKALDWEAKCHLKDEEIRNLQATNHLLRVGLDAMLAVKEVKP